MVDTTKWYSPDDVAELLHLNVQTVRRHIRARRLLAKRAGKLWRISDEALQAFMENECGGDRAASAIIASSREEGKQA